MEKSPLLFVMIPIMTIVMFVVIMVAVIILSVGIGAGRHFRCGTLDKFVQLAAIQPHSAALRAKINFYALTFCYIEGYIAYGTIHGSSSFSG
jgi:hypothetical protein